MKRLRLRWPNMDVPRGEAPLSQRLLWMVVIWSASTVALLAVALLLRAVLRP